jgi:prevent-host-death family protein
MSVSDAKAQLTDLVRRAESGEDVILTRHGQPAVPVSTVPDRAARRALLDSIWAEGGRSLLVGPPAARSQDFLYGDDGLPV